MTTQEAAESLGLNPATVRMQIGKGRLRAEKRGRDWWLTPSEIERYRREVRGQRRGRWSKRP